MVDRKTVERFIDRDRGTAGAILAVVSVSMLRNVGEWIMGRPAGLQTTDLLPTSLLVGLTQGLAFYAMMFWLMVLLLAQTTGRRIGQVSRAVSIGLVLGVLPPLFDAAVGTSRPVKYGYGTTLAWLFTGQDFPPGETAALWIAILSAGGFVLYVTRSATRGLLAAAGAYLVMQFMLVWSNLSLSWILSGFPFDVQRVAYFLLAIAAFFIVRARALGPSLLRVNHALPFALATLAGSLWVQETWRMGLGKALMMLVTMLVVIMHNDYYDRDQDASSGRASPVTADDASWLWFLAATGVLTVMLWSVVAALILASYLALGAMYQMPGARLKRIFCVSYKIEGLWGALAFMLGALGSPNLGDGLVASDVLWPAVLAFGGFALVSGLKDYKDIEADDASGVLTYYVMTRRRGGDLYRTHRRLVAACTAALVGAPLLLGMKHGYHPLELAAAGLAVLPMAWVLLVKDRTRAVEGMFWLLSVYLVVMALAMRAVTPLEAARTEVGTVIHVVDTGQGPVF